MVAKTRLKPPTKRVPLDPDGVGRRDDILAAALRLFSERDYSGVPIKDIAALADVNSSLLYYYFEDKDALFRAALEHAVEDAMAKYAAVANKHSEPVDLIDDWFQMHVDLAPQIRRLVKILMDYSSSGAQAGVLDNVVSAFYDVEIEILSSAIRRGVQGGVFHDVDPEIAAAFASTHLDGVMVRSIIQPNIDVASAVNALREAFWRYLRYSGRRAKVT